MTRHLSPKPANFPPDQSQPFPSDGEAQRGVAERPCRAAAKRGINSGVAFLNSEKRVWQVRAPPRGLSADSCLRHGRGSGRARGRLGLNPLRMGRAESSCLHHCSRSEAEGTSVIRPARGRARGSGLEDDPRQSHRTSRSGAIGLRQYSLPEANPSSVSPCAGQGDLSSLITASMALGNAACSSSVSPSPRPQSFGSTPSMTTGHERRPA